MSEDKKVSTQNKFAEQKDRRLSKGLETDIARQKRRKKRKPSALF